jgi:hypothetical protein
MAIQTLVGPSVTGNGYQMYDYPTITRSTQYATPPTLLGPSVTGGNPVYSGQTNSSFTPTIQASPSMQNVTSNPSTSPLSKAQQDWNTYHTNEGVMPVGYGGENPTSNYEDQMRAQIEQGYGDYFSSLDQMLTSGLPAQKTAQEDILKSQLAQGMSDLSTQKEQSSAELATQKVKTEENTQRTLKDLAGNIRNMMTAGNVYLGARGAGDSSAANMYSYALTKLGNKQRGDVLSQRNSILNDIADREFKLGSTYNNEKNRLTNDFNSKIAGIASWFAEAQNGIKQMLAQGQLAKSKDMAAISQQALNYAMQQLQNVQAQYYNQNAALQSWAMSRATDIQSLKANMDAISQYRAPSIGYTPIQPLGANMVTSPITYYSQNTDKDKNLYNF